MRNAVIMAGGAGTRLWPMSRRSRPKQLLRLFGGKSLLRQTFERLRTVLPADRIHVITAAAHLPLVAEALPELPIDNLIGEPMGRDTANAVGLSAAIMHERDPEGVLGVFTADHLIRPVDRFAAAVERAFTAAEAHPDGLITMGVTVGGPETAFGYLERGEAIEDGLWSVKRYAEKPDAQTAACYAASPDYYWNSGMFAWRTSAILEELRSNLPVTYNGVVELAQSWDGPKRDAMLLAIYPQLQKISIDYAVMERARNVLLVEMDCDWADVGSWSQLETVLEGDERGVLAVAKRVVEMDCRNVTLASEDDRHLMAAIGVEDIIIVHAPDATLVCSRHEAQRLKELLAQVEGKYGETYL